MEVKLTNMGRLTLEERNQIEIGLKLLFPIATIARKIKRPYTTILTEIQVNGGKENYVASKAHERVYKKIQRTKVEDRLQKLTTDVENIQMQLEILTQTIEELLNGKNK